MNKDEYLKELEKLLSDIDEQDRNEALEYYRNYFEDAGIENEKEVIETLGTPYTLSQTIKDGLKEQFDENIEIGDEGIKSQKYEDKNEVLKAKKKKERMDKRDKFIFIILLIILCVPLSAILHTFSGVIGVIFSILTFFFGFWIITFLFYICAAMSISYGVSLIFPFSTIISVGGGFIYIGIGFILIALGYVFGKISKWFFKEFLPKMFRWIADKMNSLLNRRLEHENNV